MTGTCNQPFPTLYRGQLTGYWYKYRARCTRPSGHAGRHWRSPGGGRRGRPVDVELTGPLLDSRHGVFTQADARRHGQAA